MEGAVFREMGAGDVPAALALRNEVFADYPVTAADWAGDEMEAAIALLDGEVVGAIPLAPRELVVGPARTIAAPFENAVGTRAALRGLGLGAGMIAAARDFLRQRADGLFVYREGERSAEYRFYAKTGHHDLVATRPHRLREPGAMGRGVGHGDEPLVVAGAAAIAAHGAELLPLFRASYDGLGGYPPRSVDSWRRALASSIFVEVPTEPALLRVEVAGRLAGYALVGVRAARPDGWLRVMEMATAGGDLALAVRTLTAVAAFAAARGLAVEIVLSDEDPALAAVRALGFESGPRAMFLMGQIIDVPRFFARHRPIDLGGVGLRVATEDADHELSEPAAGSPTLTLEMKEATLHRWLLGRANLAAHLDEGTVTAYGARGTPLGRLRSAIPPTPWAFHALDWI